MALQCPHCQQSFRAQSSWKRHLNTKHGEGPDPGSADRTTPKPYQCSWCPKAFTRPDALRRHLKQTHLESASPRATCKICAMPICRDDYAKKHRRQCLTKLLTSSERLALVRNRSNRPESIYTTADGYNTNHDRRQMLLPADSSTNQPAPAGLVRFKHFSPPDQETIDQEIKLGLLDAICTDDTASFDTLLSQAGWSFDSVKMLCLAQSSHVLSRWCTGLGFRMRQGECTLLHATSGHGKARAVQHLLFHGFEVDTATGGGFTALHFASYMGHTEIIGVLLQAGADVNRRVIRDYPYYGPRYLSPLTLALTQGFATVARVLIQYGADYNVILPFPNSFSNKDYWVSRFLCVKPTREVIQCILNDIDVDFSDDDHHTHLFQMILTSAIRRKVPEVIQQCLDRGVPLNFEYTGQTPLVHAIILRDKSLVRLLLGRGASPDGSESNPGLPLLKALMYEAELVQILLDAGADVNLRTRAFLSEAKHSSRRLQLLIGAGIDLNVDQGFFVTEAIDCANSQMLGMLLKAGASLQWISTDTIERLQRTCLREFRSGFYGRNEALETVTLLRQYGVDVSIPEPRW